MIQWKKTLTTDINGQIVINFTDDDLPGGNHLLSVDVSLSVEVDTEFPVRVTYERSANTFTVTVIKVIDDLPLDAVAVTLTLIGGE